MSVRNKYIESEKAISQSRIFLESIESGNSCVDSSEEVKLDWSIWSEAATETS